MCRYGIKTSYLLIDLEQYWFYYLNYWRNGSRRMLILEQTEQQSTWIPSCDKFLHEWKFVAWRRIKLRRWVFVWWKLLIKNVVHSHTVRYFTASQLVWHLAIRKAPCSSLHEPMEFSYASRLNWNFTDGYRYHGDQQLSMWSIPVVLDWLLHTVRS